MTALVEALYPAPLAHRSPVAALKWWESRRWLYNRVVGSTGLFSLAVIRLVTLIPGVEGPPPEVFVVAPLAVAIAANVCYTAGWGIEMLARLLWGNRAPRMGAFLFREGLFFSVGLTLLPLVVLSIVGIMELIATFLPWS